MNPSSFHRLKRCRHGLFLYNVNDSYIGKSLDLYGEFSELELNLLGQWIRPGDVVLDVGANVGTHCVFFARQVGPAGRVLAFEPQRLTFQMLCANVALNGLTNVDCRQAALGRSAGTILVPCLDPVRQQNFGGLGLGQFDQGEAVPQGTIDRLELPSCAFMKIDVEGMECDVLDGAVATIHRCQPVLYVENDRKEKAAALLRRLDTLKYQLWWHRPPMFNPRNFAGNSENVFGRIVSVNVLCIPKSVPQSITGLAITGLERVDLSAVT